MQMKGPANMYVYNELAMKSVTMIKSRLNNKHLSICYHVVREEVTGGKVRIGLVPLSRNIAEFLTKVLYGS